MPTPDEPLSAVPEDEIEEISTDFIIQEEPAAPPLSDDPFVAASRALVAEPAPAPKVAPRAPSRAAVPAARAAPREPERPAVEPPKAQTPAPPVTASSPEPSARRQGFPLVVALLFLLVGAAGGFFAGVLWERQGSGPKPQATTTPPVAASPAEPAEETAPDEPKRPATKGAKPARKPPAPTAAKAPAAKGKLKLTAPAEAVVYLDGRRIGKGSMNVDVPVGVHRIEVRLGKAKVAEKFWIEPNETWTYDVTPAK
jgi:hypothetical protein